MRCFIATTTRPLWSVVTMLNAHRTSPSSLLRTILLFIQRLWKFLVKCFHAHSREFITAHRNTILLMRNCRIYIGTSICILHQYKALAAFNYLVFNRIWKLFPKKKFIVEIFIHRQFVRCSAFVKISCINELRWYIAVLAGNRRRRWTLWWEGQNTPRDCRCVGSFIFYAACSCDCCCHWCCYVAACADNYGCCLAYERHKLPSMALNMPKCNWVVRARNKKIVSIQPCCECVQLSVSASSRTRGAEPMRLTKCSNAMVYRARLLGYKSSQRKINDHATE